MRNTLPEHLTDRPWAQSEEVALVYFGDNFYTESGSVLSSLYTEDGERFDYGFMKVALQNGYKITIRQSTEDERQKLRDILNQIVESK
jgi:hypothetical protein